ncbi:hypothetical protein [Nonomuraea sp. NPDC049684]|uniref:hypothetical protein n=1 Tax=Nonomuraea sp. NPDC049684 TaxID=3364356 RepID=UPI0037B53924
MSSGRNTVMIYLYAVGVLLLAGLIAFAPRQIWLPALVMALAAGAAPPIRAVIRRRSRTQREPTTLYVPPPPPPVEPREHRVERVPLPSREDDYDFLLSATILWAPLKRPWDDRRINPEALAVNAILKRARKITEQWEPGRASLVMHELGEVLGSMEPDNTGCVQVMAQAIQLTLSTEDQERLNKLAAVRKDKVVWEHDRKYEQSKREYLGEDVLKDTGSAVVWWLAKNDDHIERTVNDLGLLARLTSAANNRELLESNGHGSTPFEPFAETPSPNGNSPVDHLAAFVQITDLREKDLFTHQVALLVGTYGRPDVADEILSRFGLSDPEPPDSAKAPQDEGPDDPDGFHQNGWDEGI